MDDTGHITLDQRYADADVWCEWALKGLEVPMTDLLIWGQFPQYLRIGWRVVPHRVLLNPFFNVEGIWWLWVNKGLWRLPFISALHNFKSIRKTPFVTIQGICPWTPWIKSWFQTWFLFQEEKTSWLLVIFQLQALRNHYWDSVHSGLVIRGKQKVSYTVIQQANAAKFSCHVLFQKLIISGRFAVGKEWGLKPLKWW